MRREETGATTALTLSLIGVLVFVTIAVGGVVGVVGTHRRTQAAADLAALAGATALQDGADPCARASVIARRNGARLHGCRVQGSDVTVQVVADARLPGPPVELRARGRAGPAQGLRSE